MFHAEFNPTNMTAEVIMCDAEYAKSAIAASAGNRNTRKHRLKMYCRDRTHNRWGLTHQGIVWGTDGKLYDGHHRMEMVVETGLPTPFLVVKNLDPKNARFIDAGLPRSARDALKMAGDGDYTNQVIAIAKCYSHFPKFIQHGGTTSDVLRTLEEFCEGITFSSKHLRRGVGISRGTRTLVARAFWHCNRERLKEFCDILVTGLPKDPESDCAAIAFRNYLMRNAGNSGSHLEVERYRKGQNALRNFLKREPLSKVYASEEDLFPVLT